MERNHLFPLRIVVDMKGKTNTRVTFKEESKETLKPLEKKENASADFHTAFQTEVQDEFWMWHF